jgi:hypothetical protein
MAGSESDAERGTDIDAESDRTIESGPESEDASIMTKVVTEEEKAAEVKAAAAAKKEAAEIKAAAVAEKQEASRKKAAETRAAKKAEKKQEEEDFAAKVKVAEENAAEMKAAAAAKKKAAEINTAAVAAKKAATQKEAAETKAAKKAGKKPAEEDEAARRKAAEEKAEMEAGAAPAAAATKIATTTAETEEAKKPAEGTAPDESEVTDITTKVPPRFSISLTMQQSASRLCPIQGRSVALISEICEQRREYKRVMRGRIEKGDARHTDAVADRYKAAVKESFSLLNELLHSHVDKIKGLMQYRNTMLMTDFGEAYEGKEDGKKTKQPRKSTLMGQALQFWEWVIELNVEDEVSECLFSPASDWKIRDMTYVRNAIITGGLIRV